MLSKEKLKQIETEDLRLAAIHEVGHAVLFREHGHGAIPFVFRNPHYYHTGRFKNPDPFPLPEYQDGLAEKLWLGTCRPMGGLLPRNIDRLISLAGWLSEQIDLHGARRQLHLCIGDNYTRASGVAPNG